jgi:hypothetical protein
MDQTEKPTFLINPDRFRYKIDFETSKYDHTIADLFLVAYCKKVRNQRCQTILINDETRQSDNKIIKNIPDVLFAIYREELKFSLNY